MDDWDLELEVGWHDLWPVLVAILFVRQLLLPRPVQELRFYLKWLISGGSLVFACVAFAPLFCLQPRNVTNTKYFTFLIKKITGLMGVTWEIRGKKELLENGRECIIIANHQSNLDMLGMCYIWDCMVFKIVAKRMVLFLGPIGFGAWMTGMVFINSYADLLKAAEDLTKQKMKMWIFPEGRMNKKGASLLPFKKGAFRLAVSCQLPILPVVFSPYYFLDEHRHVFESGKVIVTVLPAISTTGLTLKDVDALTEKTRTAILETYMSTYREILSDNQVTVGYNKFAGSKALNKEMMKS